MRGKVYLVGAGPGSPDLITVKGLRILRQADVVIYDYLIDRQLLAECKEGAELICCDKLGPSTSLMANGERSRTIGRKRYRDGFLAHNEKTIRLVLKKAAQGKKVMRLKNGDPGIFSRLSQELEQLIKERVEFEIVPGVTAASAASCFSGIPLTDRRFASACVFITGHEDPKKENSLLDWKSLSKSGTLVLYMAVENLQRIAEHLLAVGKKEDTPVAIVQDASLPTQKIITGVLKDIISRARQYAVKPPAIIIVGELVRLEKRFNWLKKSKRILFTGIAPPRFFEKGTVFYLPLIKIKPLSDYSEFDGLLKGIGSFSLVVFSSRYGVQYFFERLDKIGYDARSLHNSQIAAIGGSTRKRLLDFGIRADLSPEEESSRGLLSAFRKIDIQGKKIFLPRSDLSDKGLAQGLEAQGAKVSSCVAYKNVMPGDLPDLEWEFFDEVIFTSPSAVRNFVKRYQSLPEKVKISCIGDVTLQEAKRCQLLNLAG